jgi:hypothetical protein
MVREMVLANMIIGAFPDRQVMMKQRRRRLAQVVVVGVDVAVDVADAASGGLTQAAVAADIAVLSMLLHLAEALVEYWGLAAVVVAMYVPW